MKLRHIHSSRGANYCLNPLGLVETFSVDLMPKELNSIPEEVTLLLVSLQTLDLWSFEHAVWVLQMLLISFAQNDHVIEDTLGARYFLVYGTLPNCWT